MKIMQGLRNLFRGRSVRARFDLAQTTAENAKHWANSDALSARAAISPAVRRVVRIRSRYESENNSWYRGMLRTAVNHIVGNGPRLQMLTKNPRANTRIENAWNAWAKRVGLARKLRSAVEAYWRDGEVFVMRAAMDTLDPIDLDVRLYEADQVASPWLTPSYDRLVDDGIRFNTSGYPVAYHILDEHPGSNFGMVDSGREYPVEDVLHLYREERPQQTRGIPRATSALQTLPIMRRQELATLFSAESAANFAVYMKTTGPGVTPAEAPEDFAEIEITRNMLTMIPEGWDIGQVDPKQPGPQYEMFQRQALQSFARCTNMPYALAAGTARDSNFSSYKGDIRNVWEPEVNVEHDEIEGRVLNRVFEWFLESAVFVPGMLRGVPPIAEVNYTWHWPPLPNLDELTAAKAAAARISSGQSTLTEEHARRSRDWEQEAERGAADFGVSIEDYKRAVYAVTFGLTPSIPSGAEKPQSEPEPEQEPAYAQAAEGDLIAASDAQDDLTIIPAINITIQAADAGSGQRRFRIEAYDGGELLVSGFNVPVVIDLSGLVVTGSIPILIDHKASVETTLGITDTVENNGKVLSLGGVVTATSQLAKGVIEQHDAGQKWQASIGARILQGEEVPAGKQVAVNGRMFTGPLVLARKSTLRETSVLPMGAATKTSVNLAASAATTKGFNAMTFTEWTASIGLAASAVEAMDADSKAALELAFEAAQKQPEKKIETTTVVTASAETATGHVSGTTTANDVQAQMVEFRRQIAADQRRVGEIQRIAKSYPDVAATAIEEGWSAEKVELAVLKKDVARTRPTSFTASENTADSSQVIEAALCLARQHDEERLTKQFGDKVLQAAHSRYRREGIGLQQMFLQAAAQNGMAVHAGTKIVQANLREVLAYAFPDVRASFSTLSLPGILSNVANKEILMGYMEEDSVWREIAKVQSVSDFKTVTTYRMLDDMRYELLGPGGEIKHGSVDEESYTRQAKTYAKMFALTRTDIINDDLGAFDDLRNRIGAGAAQKLNDVFWTTFLANSSFFTTARTNYIEGSTTNLGADGVGLGLGITAYRKRRSPSADSSKRLGGRPAILLVPPELEFIAEQLYTATNRAAVKASDVNVHVGKYKPVVANQLSDSAFTGNSATAWYLFGPKTQGAPVAVSFLNGQETPTVDTAEADFSTLGIQMRGYHDFGCDLADYLSGIKSKGAA